MRFMRLRFEIKPKRDNESILCCYLVLHWAVIRECKNTLSVNQTNKTNIIYIYNIF